MFLFSKISKNLVKKKKTKISCDYFSYNYKFQNYLFKANIYIYIYIS